MNKTTQSVRDKNLILTFKSDDSTEKEKSKAFNQLYSNHERQLMQYLLRYNHSLADAQDLRTIVFQKVFENIEDYDENKGAFSTWLYKIANRVSIDFSRKKTLEVISADSLKKRAEENEGFGEFQFKSDVQNPEELIIGSDKIKKIHEALSAIKNDKTRTILKLRFIDGYTNDEIAEMLDIDVESSTVRVAVNRGRKQLQELLGDIRFS